MTEGTKTYPRIAGLDYGTRYVGLAVTDPLRMFTRPVGTFAADEAVAELRSFHESDGLDRIVVGWPVTMQGEEGEETARVAPFVERLEATFSDIRVERWDERYTTQRAHSKLYESDHSRPAQQDPEKVNAMAAAVILEEYLEQHQELAQ